MTRSDAAAGLIDGWFDAARRRGGRVVFPEGEDPRVVEAACRLRAAGVCEVHVIGRRAEIASLASTACAGLPDDVMVHEPNAIADEGSLPALVREVLLARGMDADRAAARATEPVSLGAAMVRRGDVDACVAGAATPSAAVMRAAVQIVGLADGRTTVSGAFLMVLPDGRAVTYSDCAVVPAPTPQQLAEIGAEAAALHERLTGEPPLVAFLSFSTKGSAEHPSVALVREAVERARSLSPDVLVDGELQFDAAFVESVGRIKAPGSPVAGRANVFVFPNLDAGNIAYKITERVGGALAVGPILAGLARPVSDLSRGCTVDDIAIITAVSLLRAEPAGVRDAAPLATTSPPDRGAV